LSHNNRLLIVGCGRICKRHTDVLLELQSKFSIEFAGAVDPIYDRRQYYSKLLNCKSFETVADAVTNSIFDTAIIMTPSGTHAKIGLSLLNHVSNLIIEKPLCLSLDEADLLIDRCLKTNTRLFVIKQNRLNPPIQYLKKRVSHGDFGRISLATVRVRWCRPQAYYDQDSWRGTWELDGGVLTNQASHHIDLLQWLLGDVIEVAGMTSEPLVNIETEDTAGVLLKFSNGALGIIEATTTARPSDIEGSISILGERGLIVVGGKAVNRIEVDTLPPIDSYDEFPDDEPTSVYGFGHKGFYEIFFSSDTTSSTLVDGLEGRRSLELIHAIYHSVDKHVFVELNASPRFLRLGL